MRIETIVVGFLEVNCYLVGCTDSAEIVIIDPGDDVERIKQTIKDQKLVPKAVINTHAHLDHVGGVHKLKEDLKIPYYVHAEEKPLLQTLPNQQQQMQLYLSGVPEPDMTLTHEQNLSIADMNIKILYTPGHSPGGICLLVEDNVFSGDTLFAGSIGRSDLPGGNHQKLIKAISDHLLTLPDETHVYPGHGPATTIGNERLYNPFLS